MKKYMGIYKRRDHTLRAIRVGTEQIVETYCGQRIASVGDYICVEEDGKTMVVKGEKFEKLYQRVDK